LRCGHAKILKERIDAADHAGGRGGSRNKYIADKKLTKTLRNLDKLNGKDHVHETWQGSNYDYFWIVEYPSGSSIPSSFKDERQEFTGTYAAVPSNHWGKGENLPKNSGCKS
jgi:hypothetical protein